MTARLSPDQDRDAVNLIRGFAMDAPLKAKSGHQGTAMALAPLVHVLYSRVLRHDPAQAEWPDRDRFMLSNGHASILQYSALFLAGYGMGMDDIQAFRSFESATPGHPEARHTTGVEVTTGPLGQGFANAVGMAFAERFLRARFGDDLQDHHTYVIAGDGCFMEGVSHEAASLAGHQRLGRLICVYDDNHVTIDGDTSLSYSDDVPARFGAYGWKVSVLGEIGEDMDALEAALTTARDDVDERPKLLVLRSHIAFPSPDFTDDPAAHANPLKAEDVTRAKAVMGIPDESFWAPAELVSACRAHCAERGREWSSRWAARRAERPDTTDWDAAWNGGAIAGWDADLPVFDQGDELATRVAVKKVWDVALPGLPGLLSGAGDLTGNTGTELDGQSAQSATDHAGRQLHYGVREHGMGSALVGMAMHGGVLPVGGTFFVFYDYMRPPVRLAALERAKCIFVFSHDSVGVGEDGPTHQPIEQLAGLRAVPGLQVIRPADGNETVHAVRAALDHDGPTALVLSRQGTKVVTDGSAVARGAGIVRDTEATPQVVLVATGTEVAVCVEAAEKLAGDGIAARVVSLPSWDRFEDAGADYQREVLGEGVPVLSVEAATTFGWARWADDSVGINRFGASAPGAVVLDKLGINVAHVVERATALVTHRSSRTNGS